MQADLKGEQLVRDSFTAALAAGQPGLITSSAYNRLPQTPTAIIALGKAAGAMAAAVRDAGYQGVGLVITTDENHRQIAGFECFASAHPVPDERGLAAATAVEKNGFGAWCQRPSVAADQRWWLGIVAGASDRYQPSAKNCAE